MARCKKCIVASERMELKEEKNGKWLFQILPSSANGGVTMCAGWKMVVLAFIQRCTRLPHAFDP